MTEQTETVWVRTEPTADGTGYMVTVNVTDDHAQTLGPAKAVQYARRLLAAANAAMYDAAVARQLQHLGVPMEAIAQAIIDLRKDRPADVSPTDPLTLEPGINEHLDPFLAIKFRDEQIGQWSPSDAYDHAMNVLGAITTADLDHGYYRILVGVVGLPEHTARAAVDNLAEFRDPAW